MLLATASERSRSSAPHPCKTEAGRQQPGLVAVDGCKLEAEQSMAPISCRAASGRGADSGISRRDALLATWQPCCYSL